MVNKPDHGKTANSLKQFIYTVIAITEFSMILQTAIKALEEKVNTMIGHPTVDVPPSSPWPHLEDTIDDVYSPFSPHNDIVAALGRYLPSNHPDPESDTEPDAPVDAYSSDHFRMYEFKVRRCPRGRSHDWTECPYAHPGEKARRRDPRKFHYSGTACPDFRKGNCRKGDACEYAHGVFECWLHPARYRTQPCKDGVTCRRRVCFFAHTPDQLRIITHQSPKGVVATDFYDMSPLKQSIDTKGHPFLTSPSSPSPDESPPVSPMTRPTQLLSRSLGSSSIKDVMASLRSLQLGKAKPIPSSSWIGFSGIGSPLRPGFFSVPTTTTRPCLDLPDRACEEDEPVMERVESGRDLRVRMFEKLSKENSFSRANPEPSNGGADVGWVSELVK